MAKRDVVGIDRATVRFVARLLVFSLPMLLIIATGYEFAPLMNGTHFLALTLLQATNVPVANEGALITVPVEGGTWAAYVSWDSSGWKSLLLFFALVMATEASTKKKLAGLSLLPLVYAVNVARVWFMFFFVHRFGLENYELVHGTLWSWGMIVFTLALWLSWRHWTKKYGENRKEAINMGYDSLPLTRFARHKNNKYRPRQIKPNGRPSRHKRAS
ncbi:MAG: exosortase/archaeosortase family protein [Candidatus Aenigmarchaeota archaeon]|nr:exosortase/archaeosortase family protein [Candidatus Aenigmarchaeota archaeon]